MGSPRRYVFQCFKCGTSRVLKFSREFGLSVKNVEVSGGVVAARLVSFKNGGAQNVR